MTQRTSLCVPHMQSLRSFLLIPSQSRRRMRCAAHAPAFSMTPWNSHWHQPPAPLHSMCRGKRHRHHHPHGVRDSVAARLPSYHQKEGAKRASHSYGRSMMSANPDWAVASQNRHRWLHYAWHVSPLQSWRHAHAIRSHAPASLPLGSNATSSPRRPVRYALPAWPRATAVSSRPESHCATHRALIYYSSTGRWP